MTDKDWKLWLVPRDQLLTALRDRAKESGVDVRPTRSVTAIDVHETGVTVKAGREAAAKLLLLATEVNDADTGNSILSQEEQAAGGTSVHYNAQPGPQAENGLDVVFATGRPLTRAVLATTPTQVTIELLIDAPNAAIDQVAPPLLQRLFERGLIASHELKPISVQPSSGGRALQFEQHVGKRTLRIGDAGGFRAALAHEAIYPALQSGKCAGDVAVVALNADSTQDALMDFRVRWRESLAEYLQMPNADLPLLLPLIFRNERMCERIARAILLGEAF